MFIYTENFFPLMFVFANCEKYGTSQHYCYVALAIALSLIGEIME